jgi:hypothetical protein
MPFSIFAELGIPVQPPSAVALSVALLAADKSRHGQMIFSEDSMFKEVDEEVLQKTANALGMERESQGEMWPKLMGKIREYITKQQEGGK